MIQLPNRTDREIGNAVAKARESLGMTRGELAKAADLSRHVIDRLEQGETKPRMDTYQALLKVFNGTSTEATPTPMSFDSLVVELIARAKSLGLVATITLTAV